MTVSYAVLSHSQTSDGVSPRAITAVVGQKKKKDIIVC